MQGSRELADADLPGRVLEWVSSSESDKLLVETVRTTYPEQEQFLAHFRGLTGMWVDDQQGLTANGG